MILKCTAIIKHFNLFYLSILTNLWGAEHYRRGKKEQDAAALTDWISAVKVCWETEVIFYTSFTTPFAISTHTAHTDLLYMQAVSVQSSILPWLQLFCPFVFFFLIYIPCSNCSQAFPAAATADNVPVVTPSQWEGHWGNLCLPKQHASLSMFPPSPHCSPTPPATCLLPPNMLHDGETFIRASYEMCAFLWSAWACVCVCLCSNI